MFIKQVSELIKSSYIMCYMRVFWLTSFLGSYCEFSLAQRGQEQPGPRTDIR